MCILENRKGRIVHKNTKARKDFILDMLFVNVSITLLYVSLNEVGKFEEGVKVIHKNKERKTIQKIREVYDILKVKRDAICNIMDSRDIETLDFKNKDKVAKSFIRNVSLIEKEISLEYLAVFVLELGLGRKRASEVNERVSLLADFKMIYKNIVKKVVKINSSMDFEFELAKKFVSDVKY